MVAGEGSKQRRARRRRAEPAGQYSLFTAAAVEAAPADPGHFRRQAALCRRLAGALHQADVVDLLERLESEYEALAEAMDARDAAETLRRAG